MTEDQKEEIIKQAKRVCLWIGWMKEQRTPGVDEVEKLRDLIQKATGKELEEYT